MIDIVLQTHGLTKNFGGLCAVDSVSITLCKGEVHAILGPNGAGKSTLVNLLSGDLIPSSGTVMLGEVELTGMPPYKISHMGVGRSFQKTNIFPKLTCFENIWLAAQSRQKTSMRFFRPVHTMTEVEELTLNSLKKCDLLHRKNNIANSMSYGEQRQLEIGMMLATKPQLLLMDEPMAGMGKEESEMLVELIKELSQEYALLLIEHDMDAVFAVADKLTVMVNGSVLETGTPEQIKSSQQVQEAYLGEWGG